MNEFGKRTVSRSGRIGSSDGMASGRSPFETILGLEVLELDRSLATSFLS